MRSTVARPPRVIALVATLVVTLLAGAAMATEPKVYGIELVPYSRQIDEDRYRSSRDWEGSMRHFKKKFAGWKYIRWHSVVNLPTVKYVFIENTYPKRQFDGINVYELPGGEVRMYILKHPEPEQAAETEDTSQGQKPAG
jgi:hypothetical protein